MILKVSISLPRTSLTIHGSQQTDRVLIHPRWICPLQWKGLDGMDLGSGWEGKQGLHPERWVVPIDPSLPSVGCGVVRRGQNRYKLLEARTKIPMHGFPQPTRLGL